MFLYLLYICLDTVLATYQLSYTYSQITVTPLGILSPAETGHQAYFHHWLPSVVDSKQ